MPRGTVSLRSATFTPRGRVDQAVQQAGQVAMWFSAEDLRRTASSATPSTWNDRRRRMVASAVGTPTFTPNGFNNRPTIANASAKGFTLTSPTGMPAGDWTVIQVFSTTTSGSAPTDVQYGMDAETGRLICAVDSGNAGSNKTSYFDGSWRDTGTAQTTGNKVMTWSLTSGASIVRVNGTNHTTSGAYSQKAIAGTTVGLFKGYFSTDAGVDGSICEMVVYFGALSVGRIVPVERALGAYYGITVA